MTTATTTTIRESDLIQHIEDTRLFWTTRNGRAVQRCWNELSATERKQAIEAQERAMYVALFSIYEG